jgi:hypothetical protein
MKAVIAFHNGNSGLASSIFKEVEEELQVLYVPEELIDEVAAQGFSRYIKQQFCFTFWPVI